MGSIPHEYLHNTLDRIPNNNTYPAFNIISSPPLFHPRETPYYHANPASTPTPGSWPTTPHTIEGASVFNTGDHSQMPYSTRNRDFTPSNPPWSNSGSVSTSAFAAQIENVHPNLLTPKPTRPVVSPSKRPRSNTQTIHPTTPKTPKRLRVSVLSREAKLARIRDYCVELGFSSWVDAMLEMFRPPRPKHTDPHDIELYRARSISVSKFLRGETAQTAADFLKIWMCHRAGRHHQASPEMFSSADERPYHEIKPIRPALTSFALQIVASEMVSQAEIAIRPESGLHVHIPSKRQPIKAHVNVVDWSAFSSTTLKTVSSIHQEFQPLIRKVLLLLAARPQSRNRVNRPVDVVVDDIISKLAFSRSPHARLQPVMKGLFEFASNASFDTFRYESRVSNTPAYSTIIKLLYTLAEEGAKTTIANCRDPAYVVWATIDNTQDYHVRRMPRMGLENVMNLGMSCVAYRRLLKDKHRNALDYEDKQRRRRECDRNTITVPQLLRFCDQAHEKKVLSYQWLWVLGEYEEKVKHLREHANSMLRTSGAILRIPPDIDQPFTLPTNSGGEQDLPKFQGAFFDFLKHLGQTKDDNLERIFIAGGDGLTFELYGRMMDQRQLHVGKFTSLRFLNPRCEWWHGEWTNNSRIINKHLVSYSSRDPSTLGNSASKISSTIRINQGKYDYHQGTELMHFVLDMRMLDCWRLILNREAKRKCIPLLEDADVFQIIAGLDAAGALPNVADFEILANELTCMYSSEGAVHRAATGQYRSDTSLPPTGSSWQPPTMPPSTCTEPSVSHPNSPNPDTSTPDLSHSENNKRKKKKKETLKPSSEADCVLARSIDFIREAMRSREIKWAIADGDPGRVYEQMKRVMFCFAGSSHQKYAQYLLESIIDLELESSPELREVILETSLVNLDGYSGHFQACDIVHEYYNRILEAIVQHKGRDYGEHFIREGIARHLHHFRQLKHSFLDGVDIQHRSARHSKPTFRAEIQTLLEEYRLQELHSYRVGRGFGEEKVVQTDFQIGQEAMESSSLRKWTNRMMLMRSRDLRNFSDNVVNEDDCSDGEVEGTDPDWSSIPLHVPIVEPDLLTEELDPDSCARSIINQMNELEDDLGLEEEANEVGWLGTTSQSVQFGTDDELEDDNDLET
ncbi:hypothetical protein FB446DRAFT_843468 [Lentinula raphanica]|nr:hypothetical protein FB446DRAFT_843468 [Lentinula raphanica]